MTLLLVCFLLLLLPFKTASKFYLKNTLGTSSVTYPTTATWRQNFDNSLSGTTTKLIGDPLNLNIFLFFSYDYINRTQLTDVTDLLVQLSERRWSFHCRKYLRVLLAIFIPEYDIFKTYSCDAENVEPFSNVTICTNSGIRFWLNAHTYLVDFQKNPCSYLYSYFFQQFASTEQSMKTTKYLLITDVPMPCPGYGNILSETLGNYSDYSSGAPLTIIAIDKQNEESVAESFAPLFPATQLPNLYKINDINELLLTMNKSINFCLDFVPMLEVSAQKQPSSQGNMWFLYLICAIILMGLILAAMLAIFIRWKRSKRIETIRQISERSCMQITTKKHYDPTTGKEDEWEITLKSLDIDYKSPLGKGAFSIVYSGFLHGKAPILKLFPSIALQQFTDCEVAVKTLPRNFCEKDKTMFNDEIRLMKEIGYHVHLVSMLGYSRCIERPILLIELAEQDLLRWLMTTSETIKNMEINFQKTLLSIAWQISDGMSYLSSKNFIHRDIAARNVLLNSDLKAMISDFGLCHKLENGEQFAKISGGILPVKWMALESLLEQQFSTKTDV